MRWFRTVVLLIIGPACTLAPIGTLQAQTDLNETTVLLPARVFDAEAGSMREGWAVIIKGDRIQAVGPAAELGQSPGAVMIELPGATLLPGLIDAHSHVTLHPYDETPWADQVVRESLEERTIRAVAHAEASLLNGFTLLRDLGAEGAGQADVSLRDAIEAGPASYRGRGCWSHPGRSSQPGATHLDPVDTPGTSTEELEAIVDEASRTGRRVAAHASTPEGMRRAVLAGAATIEHGFGGTA